MSELHLWDEVEPALCDPGVCNVVWSSHLYEFFQALSMSLAGYLFLDPSTNQVQACFALSSEEISASRVVLL